MRRELLGTASVDSGELIVVDPSHGKTDLGVAFPSGLGSGNYEVYATIQDIPIWGERVTKVEIELIPDWELEVYQRERGGF